MNDSAPEPGEALTRRLVGIPSGTVTFDVDKKRHDHPGLPEALYHIWADYGLISMAGGRVHLIDPARLAPLMSYLFQDDADLNADVHAIAYGDLGEVVLWSGRHGYGFLSPVLATLEMPNLTRPQFEPADRQFISQVMDMPRELIEAFDPDQQPVHDRLVARLGPLPYGSIFGTTPVPPPLEGTPVEHYVIAELSDWLEAVYTEIAVTLVDWERTPSDIRPIGPRASSPAATRE